MKDTLGIQLYLVVHEQEMQKIFSEWNLIIYITCYLPGNLLQLLRKSSEIDMDRSSQRNLESLLFQNIVVHPKIACQISG